MSKGNKIKIKYLSWLRDYNNKERYYNNREQTVNN